MVVVVSMRERLGAEDGGVESFIQSEGRVGMLQIPLRDPRIFFG